MCPQTLRISCHIETDLYISDGSVCLSAVYSESSLEVSFLRSQTSATNTQLSLIHSSVFGFVGTVCGTNFINIQESQTGASIINCMQRLMNSALQLCLHTHIQKFYAVTVELGIVDDVLEACSC